jgi:hypothetical protein
MRSMKGLLLVAGIIVLSGCGSERLETGYVPQKLGDSDAVRRSYYAAPFTRESRVPKLDGGTDRMETRPQRSY